MWVDGNTYHLSHKWVTLQLLFDQYQFHCNHSWLHALHHRVVRGLSFIHLCSAYWWMKIHTVQPSQHSNSSGADTHHPVQFPAALTHPCMFHLHLPRVFHSHSLRAALVIQIKRILTLTNGCRVEFRWYSVWRRWAVRSLGVGNVLHMRKWELSESNNFTRHNLWLGCDFECMMVRKFIHIIRAKLDVWFVRLDACWVNWWLANIGMSWAVR